MVISSKMTDRCTGTTVSGNRCKNGANCHIHRDPCSVCLSRMTNDTKRRLRCGHEFHTACIDRVKESGSNQCPLCRRLFDVSQFKVSIKIINTHTSRETSADLPSDTLHNIIDGLNFDFLDFTSHLTEFDFSMDTLTDLQSLLHDIGVSNTHIDPTVFDAE